MMAGLLHVSSATASTHADPGYTLACWFESGTLPLPRPRDPPSSPEPLATNGTLCRGRDAAKRELV